jgi:predicted TIM-barrel fold metal-dependent hydrolase
MVDSHEHLAKEAEYVDNGPDLLQSLFDNYVRADLEVGGASQEAMSALLDKDNPDVRARFNGVQKAWDLARHTGYGEAVRLIAKLVYGIDEITPEALEGALAKHDALRKPGERLRLLRDVAKLDHVQIDDFVRPCLPDASGPDFFFYDISWVSLVNGAPHVPSLTEETGVEPRDLATLRQCMESVFAQYAEVAIAMKTQHAYERTLRWVERSDEDAERSLAAYLRDPEGVSEADSLCLGDWCLARGVELCIEHNLPIKIHTGYYAGQGYMITERIPAGHLSPLLRQYPQARFVLMHIAYPYSDELVALAKHYPNVYPDLCWAWSIDPFSAANFVRQCIHAVPANKLFIYGGDTFWPTASVAYAAQARQGLTRALQAEVDEGLMSEGEAIALANRFMVENQMECFRVAEKKQKVMATHEATIAI